MLKGTLDDFTLPDVFRLLSSSHKTGLVEIQRSAGDGKVYFRGGEVYYAESSLTMDPLGQKLVRAHLITDGQLRKALDEQAETSQRLGEVLVSQGVLQQEQVEGALRQQIEDSVFDLLRWELGEFTWQPDVELEPEVSISVSVENLIMEASRKLEELEVITKKIPSEAAVLAMAAAPPDGAAEINITPEEWRILVLVNGRRNVVDIAAEAGLDNFSTLRTLFGLASAGLIEVIDADTPAALAVLASELAAVEDAELAAELATEPEEDAGDDVAEGDEAEADPEEPEAEVEESEPRAEEDQGSETESEADQGSEPESETQPGEDALAAELLRDAPFEPPEVEADGSSDAEPVSELELPEVEESDIPVTADPEEDAVSEPIVDRLAAVKELADLFDQPTSEEAGPPYPAEMEAALSAEENPNGDRPKRVEDDEEITRCLISRLIDGVKGL